MTLYHINCDCCSYDWARRAVPAGKFMRCRHCGKQLGDMQYTIIETINARKRRAKP